MSVTADQGRPSVAPAASCAGEVLRLLKGNHNGLSLADLERGLPRTKSLIYRVLRELEIQGLVDRDRNGRYLLGVEAFELGAAYVQRLSFDGVLRQVLGDLSDRTGETVNLGLLRGPEVLYVLKYVQPDAFVTISHVGGRVPAHCVAVGKALLARLSEHEVRELYATQEPLRRMTSHSIDTMAALLLELETVRRTGHAIDREEAAPARAGIAVTVDLFENETAGAISISTSAERFDEHRDQLVGLLLGARERIDREVAARRSMASFGAGR